MAHRWQRAFSLRTPVTAQAVASPKLCPEQGARHRHASPWAASKTKCTQAHRTHACDMSSSVIAPSTPAHAMLKLPLGLKSTRVTQGKDASARSGTHMMRGREGGRERGRGGSEGGQRPNEICFRACLIQTGTKPRFHLAPRFRRRNARPGIGRSNASGAFDMLLQIPAE